MFKKYFNIVPSAVGTEESYLDDVSWIQRSKSNAPIWRLTRTGAAGLRAVQAYIRLKMGATAF